MAIDWSIKVGDLLTTATVAVSVIALLLSRSKDRDAKVATEANLVRAAAATAISKLDRWEALQLSLYQQLQPEFVNLSEQLAKRYDVQSVRDQLWKRVNIQRTAIANKILDEQLGTAYADLLSHIPAARTRITAAYAKLAAIEADSTDRFLGTSEQAILALDGKESVYTTPTLGNALRACADAASQQLRIESERTISPLRDYLFDIISLPNAVIVEASKNSGL